MYSPNKIAGQWRAHGRMARKHDFGLSQRIEAMKDNDQETSMASVLIRGAKTARPNSGVRMYVCRNRAVASPPIFKPRRDSSNSVCRPNARGAAVLHDDQLGIHRAKSFGSGRIP
jgi:hypothetical protein